MMLQIIQKKKKKKLFWFLNKIKSYHSFHKKG